MRRLTTGFEKLILVCLNERNDGRECCRHRGSEQVHAALKAWVKEHGLARKVRVSKSGAWISAPKAPRSWSCPSIAGMVR